MTREPDVSGSSLTEVLGGRTGAMDAGIPAVAFVTAWAVAGAVVPPDDGSTTAAVLWGSGAAFAAGVMLAGIRLAKGKRPGGGALGLQRGERAGLGGIHHRPVATTGCHRRPRARPEDPVAPGPRPAARLLEGKL